MNTSIDLEHRLIGLYKEFIELNDLEEASADEVLLTANLDPSQRKFLTAFIELWDSINE